MASVTFPVFDRVEAVLAWLEQQVPASAQLCTDSRRVQAGDVFVAWPGYARDARDFVDTALAAGARACLVEAEGVSAYTWAAEAPVAIVPGLKRMTGELAHRWYGSPTDRLKVVATTGTNGKTSTAWWTAQALTAAGQTCAVVGTLGIGTPPTEQNPQGHIVSNGLTTPDPVTLHRSLAQWDGAPLSACAIEASSIGVAEHRLQGLHIDVALFTNFTPDHLDYHGSMEAYWDAKRALFDWPGLQAAVVNVDDPKGRTLVQDLEREGRLAAWGYSTDVHDEDARWRASGTHYERGGIGFTLHEDDQAVEIQTGLIGEYNVSNSLAVLGGLRALGLPLEQMPELAAKFTPVPGRMQRVERPVGVDGPEVVVDYAHTPDALEKVIAALRPLAQARGGLLYCVFGCGGNRDAVKRPVMGRLAVQGADRVVVTSDNPRMESAEDIVHQIVAGIEALPEVQRRAAYRAEVDRALAIAQVVGEAGANDVVLIAGKGHEDYQDVAGVKHPFSDIEHAHRALMARASHKD